jgi:hypothetical protein
MPLDFSEAEGSRDTLPYLEIVKKGQKYLKY